MKRACDVLGVSRSAAVKAPVGARSLRPSPPGDPDLVQEIRQAVAHLPNPHPGMACSRPCSGRSSHESQVELPHKLLACTDNNTLAA